MSDYFFEEVCSSLALAYSDFERGERYAISEVFDRALEYLMSKYHLKGIDNPPGDLRITLMCVVRPFYWSFTENHCGFNCGEDGMPISLTNGEESFFMPLRRPDTNKFKEEVSGGKHATYLRFHVTQLEKLLKSDGHFY